MEHQQTNKIIQYSRDGKARRGNNQKNLVQHCDFFKDNGDTIFIDVEYSTLDRDDVMYPGHGLWPVFVTRHESNDRENAHCSLFKEHLLEIENDTAKFVLNSHHATHDDDASR
jgi:hypothetical protein